MRNSNNKPNELILENIIHSALQIPCVKVSRESFLADIFNNNTNSFQSMLDVGPVVSGVSRDELYTIAKKLILKRTSQSSLASFAAGIPGGLAMAATVPADIIQFFGIALKLAQELSYLYGAKELTEDEDEIKSQLILYCGVMFGVSGAISSLRLLSAQIAKTTLNKLPQKALTKTIWYPIVKQIGKAVGVKVTKNAVAKGVSTSIPVIGGVISGTLNFASMLPMANRLLDVFDKITFDYTNSEIEIDMSEIRNIFGDKLETYKE